MLWGRWNQFGGATGSQLPCFAIELRFNSRLSVLITGLALH